MSKCNCCLFSDKSSTLEDAGKAMLELYCKRAKLEDGHTVLDEGCGWGSLSLYIAEKYSNCKVTGICNSVTQKAFIEEQCRNRHVENVEIIVADISIFEMERSYDRIFSIEMFENYRDLLKKISMCLKDDGLLFVHYFCHKHLPTSLRMLVTMIGLRGTYSVEVQCLQQTFFYFQEDVSIVDHWLVNGKHYAQTSEEWLKKMDKNASSIKPITEATYGKDSAVKWTVYWRTFFISVAELFAYNNGDEWMVSHFLFKPK